MIYSAIEVLLLSVSAVGRVGALFLFPRRLASGATGGVGLTFRSGAGAGIGSSVFAALNPPPIWKSSLSETPDTFGSSSKMSVGSSLLTLGFGSFTGAAAVGLLGTVRFAGLRLRTFPPLSATLPLLGSKRSKLYFLSTESTASASFNMSG